MLNSKKILLFATCFFAAAFSIAQQIKNESNEDKYRAVHWGLAEGLSQGEVYHMLKDENGFLWIGTGGDLSRFDGSKFKNYFHDPKKSGTINAGNTAGGLVEDSLHNIWIGTDNGLFRYDIKMDTFAHFFPSARSASFNNGMSPVLATKDELFCIESDSIISIYNIHSFAKENVATLTSADSVLALTPYFDEGSNSLWMLRSIRVNNVWHGGGLLNISLATGKKKNYGWNCYKNIFGHDHSAEAMCYDHKRNCLWINSEEGLMQFTFDDKQFHYISALNDLLNSKDYGRFVGISMDLQGRIWLATRPKGIIIYNPSDQSVEFPFAKDTQLQNEISDANSCIYCDRDGIIWSGFWLRKGIYQVIPFSPSVRHYKTDTSTSNSLLVGAIVDFKNAGQGKIWLSAFDGLRVFDSRTGKIEAFNQNDLPAGLKKTAIFCPLIDTIGRKAYLVSGTSHFIMDLNTKKCDPLIFRDSANQDVKIVDDWGLCPLKDGLLMNVILDNRQSIFWLNTGSKIANEILSFPVHSIEWSDGVYASDDGYMFLKMPEALGNLTYSYLNNKWIRSPNPLDSIRWSLIVYNAKDQSYWVVVRAEKQLIHYSKDFRIIHVYTTAEGLPDIDIYSLLPDTKGNIWFNTDRSIHQLNKETGIFSTLSEKDGLPPQNFSDGPEICMGTDGDLYLGGGIFGGKGFHRISPEKYTSASSSIYLQSLEINQTPFPLSAGVNELRELSLRYFQNNITIETGIIDYYSKGSGHIRYKLEAEGQKAGWQYAPDYYTIRYEQLPPGKYRLVLQSSNAANEFNGPEKILPIYISPPFWQTWWFRIVAMLFAATLIYGFIQYRSRNLKQRNIVLEEKVMQRTNELHNSLAELKTTQDQLIQSEKMASLGELTSGIAHEIKNPLNFINNFSEINMELITEIEEEQIPILNETDLDGITSNIKTLKKNSEKINHHGKRIDEIVKGMLQHSRLGNVNKEPVNINALCDESLKLAYHGFRAKEKTFNASFETRFDPDLPRIMVIPQDFGRVLLNLINNAFYTVNEKKKQSQSESLPDALETESLYKPSVIVSTKRSGNKIIVTISDNGLGIPPAIINKIFQPFFTTKPTGEGTGLGLSMSYDIITKSHGGELRAKSKEGIGTDFEIILPI